MKRSVLTVLASLLAVPTFLSAQQPARTLTAAQAIEHVGQQATVCGEVVSATYAVRSRGRPTFLNLDKPYPNQIFTVLIWGESRTLFKAAPEKALDGKHVCVTGRIEAYRGSAEIVVRQPVQIEVERGSSGCG